MVGNVLTVILNFDFNLKIVLTKRLVIMKVMD